MAQLPCIKKYILGYHLKTIITMTNSLAKLQGFYITIKLHVIVKVFDN